MADFIAKKKKGKFDCNFTYNSPYDEKEISLIHRISIPQGNSGAINLSATRWLIEHGAEPTSDVFFNYVAGSFHGRSLRVIKIAMKKKYIKKHSIFF